MVTTFKGLANKWVVLALLLASLGAVLAITLLPAGAQNGDDAIEFPENSEEAVAYFTAVDPEGGTASWADDPLSGADAGVFSFDRDTGTLSFNNPPNFESPADVAGLGDGTPTADAAAGDNTYEVVLTATDGTATMTEHVMVKVTNEEEAATTTLELSLVQPREGDFITVVYADNVGNPYVNAAGGENTSIVDPDGDKGEVPPINAEAANVDKMNITEVDTTETPPVDLVTWQWYRGPSRSGPWTEIPGPNAKEKSYDVVDDDRTNYLRVVATYEDAHGPNKTLEAVSQYPTIKLVADAKTPVFPDFDPSTSPTPIDGPTEEAADGTTNEANIGSPVLASGDTIERGERPTYYLVATDGNLPHADMFQIDRATGQVRVGIGKTLNPASDTGRPASDIEANPGAPGTGYMVTIKINDGKGDYDADGRVTRTVGGADDTYDSSTTMTITVTEEDEAPIFTMGEMAYDYSENKMTDADPPVDDLNVDTFAAYDPEGTTVVLTLSGPDVSKFATTGATNVLDTGALTFVASTPQVAGDQPDYENPEDANEDGVYEVTVTATAGAENTPLPVRVTVTNAQDPGEVSLSARQPRIGVPITATVVSDEDGDVTGLRWQWSATRLATTNCLAATLEALTDTEDEPRWQAAKGDGAGTATYTPETGDFNKCLRARAMYTDPAGSTSTAEVSAQRAAKARNLSPMFMDENLDADGIQIKTRYVLEPSGAGTDDAGTTDVDEGRQVVANREGAVHTDTATPNADRIVATDLLDEETADDDSIEYSLSGPDARYFDIYSVASHSVADPFDSTDTTQTTNAGQIWVKPGVNLDFEVRRTYRVQVTAKDLADDDESRNDPSIWVEIRVVNAEEPPEIMQGRLAVEGAPLVEYDSMDTEEVGTYRAVGVDAPSAEWTLSGDDAGVISISTGGVLTFNSPPDFNNPDDLNRDNVYMVTVVATSADSMDSLGVTVTVGSATPVQDRTDIGDYPHQVRLDFNGDGTVSDDELLEAITIWTLDNLDN